MPLVAAIIGEGGSGGAIAIAAGNTVLMLEHAIYSVISPEGCASILWRDAGHAQEAAEALRLTAQDLLRLGVIDRIVPEPLGGAHRAPRQAIAALGDALDEALRPLLTRDGDSLRAERRRKFLAIGTTRAPECIARAVAMRRPCEGAVGPLIEIAGRRSPHLACAVASGAGGFTGSRAYPRWKVAMTPQERDLITTLLDRLKDTASAGQPKDPEADALIRQAMRDMPDAPYYLVQTVLIQDLSLHQAQNRIAELEQQLADAKNPSGGSFLGNLFGTPRGRAASTGARAAGRGAAARKWRAAAAGRRPRHMPSPAMRSSRAIPSRVTRAQQGGMMSGMMGGGAAGGGFLRSAAATAAGIAGGALLFQGISSLFGHGYANSLAAPA